MSTIALWFDGGGPYGFGNVRRSTELGEALARRGHAVSFVPLSERAASLCPKHHSNVSQADVIVLDVPYEGDAVVQQARAWQAKVVALDFDGTEAPDVVISLQAVRRVPAQSKILCGVEYAIIREEIHSLGTQHETTGEVLVIVGGGDQDGLTQRIVDRLYQSRRESAQCSVLSAQYSNPSPLFTEHLALSTPHKVCVVQGPAGAPLNLERDGLRIVTNPPDLPQLMARCAWAVTTGGTTMLEMLCLGKAIHVVPRTEPEQIFAQRFADQAALLGLGLEPLRTPTMDQIAACQQRGPQLVDGKGCERIAIEIESLL